MRTTLFFAAAAFVAVSAQSDSDESREECFRTCTLDDPNAEKPCTSCFGNIPFPTAQDAADATACVAECNENEEPNTEAMNTCHTNCTQTFADTGAGRSNNDEEGSESESDDSESGDQDGVDNNNDGRVDEDGEENDSDDGDDPETESGSGAGTITQSITVIFAAIASIMA